MARLVIRCQLPDGLAQPLSVTPSDEEPVNVPGQDLCRPADARGDDRLAAGSRLEIDQT